MHAHTQAEYEAVHAEKRMHLCMLEFIYRHPHELNAISHPKWAKRCMILSTYSRCYTNMRIVLNNILKGPIETHFDKTDPRSALSYYAAVVIIYYYY